MATAQPKIGLFAGIFKEGRLLIRRRQPPESLSGEWDLPGGAVEADNNAKALDERVIGKELAREVMEETGLKINIKELMPAMYPAIIRGGVDWAFMVCVGKTTDVPTRGEYKWVSIDELNELAKGPDGNRLVGGWGRRMHRLCLCAFANSDSANIGDDQTARRLLNEIQANWD